MLKYANFYIFFLLICNEKSAFGKFLRSTNDCPYFIGMMRVICNADGTIYISYIFKPALKEAYIRFADSADVAVSLYRDLPLTFGQSFGFDKSADYYFKPSFDTRKR